jgi:hypothetical protein
MGFNGEIECIFVNYIPDKVTKKKGNLSWISSCGIEIQYNIFSDLYMKDGSYNDNSCTTFQGIIESLPFCKGDRFQIERVGYFIVDQVEPLKMNQIVGL